MSKPITVRAVSFGQLRRLKASGWRSFNCAHCLQETFHKPGDIGIARNQYGEPLCDDCWDKDLKRLFPKK